MSFDSMIYTNTVTIESTFRNAADAMNPWWSPGTPLPRFAHFGRRRCFAQLHAALMNPDLRRAQLLVGPRQVGKSTLLAQLAGALLDSEWPAGNLTYFDFSDYRLNAPPRHYGPEDVAEIQPAGLVSSHPRVLLLDEIHWAKNWDRWLKQTVDRDRLEKRPQTRVLATGSAASLLRRGSEESGQGRWPEIRLLGLTFAEHLVLRFPDKAQPNDLFTERPQELERYLALGGFPEHIGAEPSPLLRAQVREDVAERALRRDLASLNGARAKRLDTERLIRLFVYFAQESGAVLNVQARARDLDGAKPLSVTNWLKLLEDACLMLRVDPWPRGRGGGARRASARLAVKPKIYASDHGLITAFAPFSDPMGNAQVRGRVVETAVLRHLLDLVGESTGNVHYYRRSDGLEVDFVLELDGLVYAVEVTSERDVDEGKVRRLSAAAGAIGADRAILIHCGSKRQLDGGVRWLPLHCFLLDPRCLLEDRAP